MDNQMSSEDLARYIEATDSIAKPWMLLQLRLKKLQETRDQMSAAEYEAAIVSLHEDLMNLGEWWVGREDEVFGHHA